MDVPPSPGETSTSWLPTVPRPASAGSDTATLRRRTLHPSLVNGVESAEPSARSSLDLSSTQHPLIALDDDEGEKGHSWTPPRSGSVTPGPSSEFANISRPRLQRLQSEIDNQVAAASVASRSSLDDGSLRSSFDVLRNGSTADQRNAARAEVEVLVHQVKAKESMQGIALQYGIDLATLKKVNKMWSTDTIALKTHLYVPIEACKFFKSSSGFVRGPREGEITILSKQTAASHDLVDLFSDPSSSAATQSPAAGVRSGKVFSVIRIPASELSFFPKSKRKPPRMTPTPLASSPTRIRSNGSFNHAAIETESIPMTASISQGAVRQIMFNGQLPTSVIPRTKTLAHKSAKPIASSWFSLADDGLNEQELGGRLP